MISDEDIAKALDRLARTADGELLYRYLQKIVMFVPGLEADDGALRVDQGRRRFALDLMALMAKGIDESDGRDHSTGGKRSERTIVFAARRPVGQQRYTNARDFLRDTDPELRRLSVDTPTPSDGSSG